VPEAVRRDKKLSARAIMSRFLGISEETKGYRLLDVYNKRHFVARSVTFDTVHCARIIKQSFGTELDVPGRHQTLLEGF
jgi:hypothetical protein